MPPFLLRERIDWITHRLDVESSQSLRRQRPPPRPYSA